MSSVTSTHIAIDNKGVAWIDDTNIKVVEVALEKVSRSQALPGNEGRGIRERLRAAGKLP